MWDLDTATGTRPSLLVRIQDARDGDAWSTFVETYAPMVFRHCRRRGLQDCDAADVTQEVMAQVARSARDFEYRPERGRFRDWLGTVARNKLANHVRSGKVKGRGKTLTLDEASDWADAGHPDPDWSAEFNAGVLRSALGRVRGLFEPGTWRAFEVTWVEGRPAAEAADELGLTVDAVYVAKSRVLKRLREEVAALAEDLPFSLPSD
jgi:RNA polymerase sigma-70 factor (ECF subfamily)